MAEEKLENITIEGASGKELVPAGSDENETPVVLTVIDILAFACAAVMLVVAASGILSFPSDGDVSSLIQSLLNLGVVVLSLIFHSCFFSDVVSRLHRGESRSNWARLDRLACIHPILLSLLFFVPGVTITTMLFSGPSFIVPFVLASIGICVGLGVPLLRWLYMTVALGYKASHLEGADGKIKFNKKAAIAGGLASLASLMTIAGPTMFAPQWFAPINLLFSAITFIYLRNIIVRTNPALQLCKNPQSLPAVSSAPIEDGAIEIRYNHFVEVQKWFKQRFALRSPWKIGLVLLILLGAVAGQLHTGILTFIAATIGPLMAHGTATAGAAGVAGAGSEPFVFGHLTATALANQIMVFLFGLITYSIFCYSSFSFVRAPKRLAAGKDGLKLIYSNASGKKAQTIAWNTIKHIKVERPPGKTSAASDRLVFERYTGAPVVLKLGGISSTDDREKLLGAIDRFAPDISREAAIEETLRRPMEQNYTELWLQALAAPPKREKLKPLVQDAVLNDNRYLVKRELGVGGQGFAYLALDKRKDKEVVLKEFVLPVFVDINARRQSLESFEKEAKLLSSLDHPQVVKLEGFFVEDHRAYLVLEHIDGQNLRQLVERDGPMSEEQILSLARQMCSILDYLHGLSPPLVHRDFTPDNLILNKDGTLKLIDFNVAQQVAYATTGTVVGKQAYLPPEQFRGNAVPASDLYAFGATLYYLAGGKDPTPISVARAQKDGLPVSDKLDHLISYLTQMEANARPENAAAVAEILGPDETVEPESVTIKINTKEAEKVKTRASE
ncbi:MAG: serine/threonine protein kinase [Cyanobacteria bacterium SZAS LIN-3]|nr:serine/threonine protein kinase [Cyanobacteria bacterium SZAS LIN-3]